MLTPSELRSPTGLSQKLISNVIGKCLNNSISPYRNMWSLNPLLGKPNGARRAICKTPVIYRAASWADDEVRTWDTSSAQPYDIAKRGSSACLAALKRNCSVELAHWLGYFPILLTIIGRSMLVPQIQK